MLRTIRLYGKLGKKYGRVHKLYVDSVGEAIRLLSANYKDFRNHITTNVDGLAGYEVWDGKQNLGAEDKEEFHKHGCGDIKIIPRVVGAGNAAKIIVGVIMIVIAFFCPPAASAMGATMTSAVGAMGMSLVLSGIIGMMTKTASGASIDSEENNKQSYLFSGVMNTTKQGNPVFIAYGTHLLGSQVISAALTTSNVPG